MQRRENIADLDVGKTKGSANAVTMTMVAAIHTVIQDCVDTYMHCDA